jgi:putative nucleotidyltransferase with HDIG domain
VRIHSPAALEGPSPGTTLLRRFTLVSLAATAVVGLVFGAVAAHLVEAYAYRERAHTIAFYVSEVLSTRLAPKDFRAAGGANASLAPALRALIGRAGIDRITVWSAGGRILYSEDKTQVGRRLPVPQYVELAREGRVAWRHAPAPRGSAGAPALEVFIPVFAAGAPRPVAVYDVVSRLPDLNTAVRQLRQSIWISIVLGIVVLYGALFSIVHQASRRLVRQQIGLRDALVGTIRALANAMDARDQATGNHSARVGEYAASIARALGLSAGAVRDAEAAGYLHDIGKIGIPDAILTKPGPLSRDEWLTIQGHALVGYEILRPVPIPEAVKLAVRHSHECWDGSGYPDGLAGAAIPLLSRIVSVADTYEALTTARPYRAAWTPQEAVEEIRRGAGTQFDPRVVGAFLTTWPRWVQRKADARAAKVVRLAPESGYRP